MKFGVTANNNFYLRGNRCNHARRFSTNTNNMEIHSLGILKKELSNINNRTKVLIKEKV